MTQDVAAQAAAQSTEDARSTLEALDAVLASVCDDLDHEWEHRSPEPIDLLREDLPQMLRGRLLPGAGKRLRPVMCHWGWVSAHGAADDRGRDDLVRTGAALELLHLFALVHDDIMDRSDSRRGRPTAHVEAGTAHVEAGALGDPSVFGDGVAILLGDLALSEAAVLVAETSAPVRRLWREMLRELVHGQLLDITAAAARHRDLSLARRVARLKSGAYTIQRPLLLGATIAGAPADLCGALSDYGGHLGEAFALRDDILGVWGDPLLTGKPVGDDLVSGKPTVVLAAARRLLPEHVFDRYLGPTASLAPEEVPELQRLLVVHGVRDEVEERITAEVTAALGCLDDAGLHPAGVAGLTDLVEVVAWRQA